METRKNEESKNEEQAKRSNVLRETEKAGAYHKNPNLKKLELKISRNPLKASR